MSTLAFSFSIRSALVAVAVVGLALWVISVCGCAGMGPYRPDDSVDPEVPGSGYRLGYVEFDDQGWFLKPGREQLLAVEQMVAQASHLESNAPQPILLIAFVHGWKNNASNDPDINAAAFSGELAGIAKAEAAAAATESRTPRPVVGVYIGWPGLSATWEPFKELSFWSRKNTGDRVGSYGGVTEVLTRLEALTNEINRPGKGKGPAISTASDDSRRSFFVVVGHSFGAQVVYNSLLPVMTENLSSSKVEKLASELRGKTLSVSAITDANRARQPLTPKERVRPFADLVVLVNPAFEGERYFNLQTLSDRFDYASGQRPVLAIFLSKGDWATHYVFPIGRFFSTLFHRYRSDEWEPQQREADLNTIPWTSSFITHTLKPDPDDALSDQTPVNPDDLWTTENRVKPMIIGGNKLAPVEPAKSWTPFYVISVDASIIKDHNDIWNDNFQKTLMAFVADTTHTKPPSPPKLAQ